MAAFTGGAPGGAMGMPTGMPVAQQAGMASMAVPVSTGPLNVAVGSTPSAQTLECAKSYVGRLIGRGGETINMIQSRSGARVQIEQNVPEGAPCRVNITGNPQNVAVAAQIVQDIIVHGPNSAAAVVAAAPNMGMMQPAGGGYYGGGGMPSAYGGQQQQPMYGGGGGYQQGGMGGGMYAPQQHTYGMLPQAGYGQQPHQQQPQPQYGGGWPTSNAQSPRMPPVAAPPPAPSLPAGWTEHKSDEGNTFWYNAATGVSQVTD